jgi:hypothetical protein
MAAPDFWSKPEEARRAIGALKASRAIVEGWTGLHRKLEEAQVLLEFAGEDVEMAREAEAAARALTDEVEALELKSFLSGLRSTPRSGGTPRSRRSSSTRRRTRTSRWTSTRET